MIDMTGVKKTWPIFKTLSKSKCNLPNYPNPKLPKNIKLAIFQVQIIAKLNTLKNKIKDKMLIIFLSYELTRRPARAVHSDERIGDS